MATFNCPTDVPGQLPREKWWEESDMYQMEGYWQLAKYLEGVRAFQSHFQSLDNDVILASMPKSGTTWMKALLSCILHKNGDDKDDRLVTNHPHVVVKTLEGQIYQETPTPNLSELPSPRLFHTHLPYHVLPESIRNSDTCKIVYITRNPKDTFTSLWYFMNTSRTPEQGPFPMEEAFEDYCNGITPYGPFFDHVLGYWKESLNSPAKILFIKYEELKRNPKDQVKRLLSFLGQPFENDEEVDKVLWRSSFERLKNLDVNKNGPSPFKGFSSSSFFRVGTVGDWNNNFTPEMSQRLDEITRSKLEGSGLELEL